MSRPAPEPPVMHYQNGGAWAACTLTRRHPRPAELTADRRAVTCQRCRGTRWYRAGGASSG